MDEQTAMLMKNIIMYTDTISTLEGILDRVGSELTDKEREIVVACINMYNDARTNTLRAFGMPPVVSTPSDEQGVETVGTTDQDRGQTGEASPRDVKGTHQKQGQKPSRDHIKKKEEEYPD
jgi:hypothetical protein